MKIKINNVNLVRNANKYQELCDEANNRILEFQKQSGKTYIKAKKFIAR